MQAVPSAVCCQYGREEVLGNEVTHHSHVRKISVGYCYYFFFLIVSFVWFIGRKRRNCFQLTLFASLLGV